MIKDAPKILYYRGILPSSDEKCLAIVGTRRYSPYGQQVALKIAGELADAGLTIVSGLAPGIDTFSHRAVIEKRKRTIAVLGTGLDEKSIYPQTNLDLSRKILEQGGCLISELPEGTSGSKFSFPRRNRIISGLSFGVLVIEAKEKSGSLITADYAIKQNKKLFAVPGQIYSVNSAGPNKLIKNGAKMITCSKDVLEEIGFVQQLLVPIKINTESDEEKLIISALENESLHVDKIIEKTKLNASVVATTLALMEISGKIHTLRGNVYSIN
ncbi:MAG: DNA-processing protein DprA [Candidatus Staskawiczbacteria bacterium]|nr:DNA-processing protein DprA [Candidatus Staskawiczbacteria bacterium]